MLRPLGTKAEQGQDRERTERRPREAPDTAVTNFIVAFDTPRVAQDHVLHRRGVALQHDAVLDRNS